MTSLQIYYGIKIKRMNSKRRSSYHMQVSSPYHQSFMKSSSPEMLCIPMKQSQAQRIIMREIPFVSKPSPPDFLQAPFRGAKGSKNWKKAMRNKSRLNTNRVELSHLYSEEQILPIVAREVSAYAQQRIKVREPSDFLKIQQRVKNDLDSMNHSNAFFRQRYTAGIPDPITTSTSKLDSHRSSTSQQCYRPRPFVDSRGGCLANYDEYLKMKEYDRSKQEYVRSGLKNQIKTKKGIINKRDSIMLASPHQQSGIDNIGYLQPSFLKQGGLQSQRSTSAALDSSRLRMKQEKRIDQDTLIQRLKDQQDMNKAMSLMTPQYDRKAHQQELDRKQVQDFKSCLENRIRKRRLQVELQNAYKDQSDTQQILYPRKLQQSLRTIDTSMNYTASPITKSNNIRHTSITPSQKWKQEEDISLEHGLLSHFFKKEMDSNLGNVGKAFLQTALTKQKQFDKVFLKHIIEGERQKLKRHRSPSRK